MGKSNWKRNALFRIENEKWLDYSAQIAMRILAAMDRKENYNQIALADDLGVSPQQVNKILKGHQNLTLKTISNISTVLDTELISFPKYEDSFIYLNK